MSENTPIPGGAGRAMAGKIIILTTATERFQIYYVNRLMRELPEWRFRVVTEDPVDFSGFAAGEKKLKTLWRKKDFKGLIGYFPYAKVDVFRKQREAYEAELFEGAESFAAETRHVDNHNHGLPLIEEFGPDLIILFGARPLTGKFLERVPCPVINHHGAILPFFRGLDPEYWLPFYKKFEYLGCSIHYVTAHLDEGRILLTRRLAPEPGARVFQLRGMRTRLHVEMIVDLLKSWDRSRNDYRANDPKVGIYRSFAPWWVQIIAAYHFRNWTAGTGG
ncbi:MAG TPA: formyltransferase family protein [bacterium]|nr:formyltransferase family protein [bacterium]HPJ71398.1 formyltransferase family protein [bacterium]HPQ66355.1 formyltransferase family protein [bacterium]